MLIPETQFYLFIYGWYTGDRGKYMETIARLLLVLFVFILAEITLFLIVRWGYNIFINPGAHPRLRGFRRKLLTATVLLPAVYGLIAAGGIILLADRPVLSAGELPSILPTPPEPFQPPGLNPPLPAPTQWVEPPPAIPTTPEQWWMPTPEETSSAPLISGDASPRGQIVYTCQEYRTRDRDQICILNADGSGGRRLTRDNNRAHNAPNLSPDGRSIVYLSAVEGVYQIFEMDLESGETWQLTFEEGNKSAPAISPDGRRILFSRVIDGHESVWVMDRMGGNQTLLFGTGSGAGWDPVWSPDGAQILFLSERSGHPQLYTMNSDGSNVRQITNMPGFRGRGDWSPDGRFIATFAGDAWDREIILMAPDGSNPITITDGGNNLSPSFSPDGSWITFTSYMDNFHDDFGCEIYMMRRDGSDLTRMTNNDICDYQPRWGP
jgi:TolB protein